MFFTAQLFFKSLKKFEAIESLLFSKLPISDENRIIDSSFEVCLFRDFAKENLIERQGKSLEKQTFDNVFVLSDKSLIIVEAKAHQKFSPNQIKKLHQAKEIILKSKLSDVNNVYLIGLHSSKYSPKNTTKNMFDACITWIEIAAILGDEEMIFKRADEIYNN